MSADPDPTFQLLEDGFHVEFVHRCTEGIGREVATLPRGGQYWRVPKAEPLTVIPSIDCWACGTHGFITDGKWVPA